MLRFLVFAIFVATVHGFSGGAPPAACKDMIPQHHADPQTEPAPYTITIDKPEIKPGDEVLVTISGMDGEKFKGFLLQAHVGDTIVGNFDVPERDRDVKALDCLSGIKNSVTHRHSGDKRKIAVTWIAPKNLQETVVFKSTVVKNGSVFWVGEVSPKLTVNQ